MKLNSADRVKILEYKFVFEEELQVKKEYDVGSADLNYRLSFFRNKLAGQNISQGQQALYDKIFMGHLPKNSETNTAISKPGKQELTQSASKVSADVKPWAKKIYRQIVMVTHPDKTSEIRSKHLKDQLTEQYRITQNAYNSELYGDLIMVAFDLNISIPESVISEEITPACTMKKNRVKDTKNLIGWQWFHVPKKQRDAELKKILIHYGFDFTEQKVSEVARRKYSKRKVGTRPKKFFKKK